MYGCRSPIYSRPMNMDLLMRREVEDTGAKRLIQRLCFSKVNFFEKCGGFACVGLFIYLPMMNYFCTDEEIFALQEESRVAYPFS